MNDDKGVAVRDLKRIVERSDTPAGVWFDQIALAAILVSLVAFSVDTLPALSSDVRQLLWLVEVVTVAIFTTEYALRLIVADSPRRFALSFFGIIDLIAILPFYLSLGVDLRSIRVLRVLRLLRIIRVGRYMQALDRLQRAGRMVREELVLFLGVSLALIRQSKVPGESEVDDDGGPVRANAHVLGLNVAMNDPLLSERGEPIAQLGEKLNRFLEGPRLAWPHLVRKIGPVNELLDNKVALLLRFRGERILVQAHHVGMIDHLHCQNLTIEAVTFVRRCHDF